jgi:formate dehydrogenase maturation protein FdhE
MRDDSLLWTGVSSQASKLEKQREARKQRLEDKQNKRTKLVPAVNVVLDELKKEKQRTVLALLETIEATTPEEVTNAVIASLNLYKGSMDNLASRLKNIMREPNEQ